VPLASKSYRFTANFPEATALAVESDVRIGGVSVGKVKSLELAPIEEQVDGLDVTKAEIEIEPEFAPISSDAVAILRSKTLLGETYVEITSGTNPGDSGAPISLGAAANNSDAEMVGVESIPEEGSMGLGQVENQSQIDEVFNSFDTETRTAFQEWQQNAAFAVRGRSLDLNDAFGNLGPFLGDASDVLALLRRQGTQLQGLVRDTGTVFDALGERGDQLAGAITGSNETFEALASEEAALRELFQVAPTFERETELTLARLDEFQQNTRPLIQDLLPVADDISPTLRSIRQLSPNLRSLFLDLDVLTQASEKGFPAVADTLRGLRPVLDNLDPFLAQLTPVVSWLRYYRTSITDFLQGPSVGISGTLEPEPGQPSARHALRQLGYITAETLAVYPNRLPENRGNGYIEPYDKIAGEGLASKRGIFPNFDCDHIGGERDLGDGGTPEVGANFAPCYVQENFPKEFGGERSPQVTRDP